MVVFGGCYAGEDHFGKSANYSIAKNIAETYDVATIGALGGTKPTKAGRKSSEFYLFYKDENGKLQKASLGNTLSKAVIQKAQDIVNDVAKKKEAAKTAEKKDAKKTE